jgi:hypothetical protein
VSRSQTHAGRDIPMLNAQCSMFNPQFSIIEH